MANNYDEYGYEDDYHYKKSSLARKLLIVVLVLIAIILIIWLLNSCSKKENKKPAEVVYDYSSDLIKAGQSYFENTPDARPSAYGECSIVELQTLIDNNLVDRSKYGKCNLNTTYVKTCVLENGVRQYTPWIKCTDKDSESEYESTREGNLSDVIANQTYTEFSFLPQKLKKGSEQLGKVEEIWKDEIKYESYKTISTTKYYSYRDKLYTWHVSKKLYYTRGGEKTSAKEVFEYYQTSPKSEYNKSDSKTTDAYKWYTSTDKKEYYMKNGAKMPSLTSVGDYTIQDPNGIDVTMYRSRTITGTSSPTMYYVCATSYSSPYHIYQTVKCGKGTNKEYNVELNTVYSCANPETGVGSLIDQIVNKNDKCYTYSAWSEPTKTKCDTSKTNICQSVTKTFYYWYKITGTSKVYYPSGSSNVNDEKVYYVSAPIKGAIKDTNTKTTAYKWYKETTSTTTSFTATAPSGYSSATKTSQYKWSDWSSYATKNPKINDGRERDIKTKYKVKLQEIQGTTGDSWENLTNNYISESELISTFKANGYNVNTLDDVLNNGEIKYQLKMYVRNKKESK